MTIAARQNEPGNIDRMAAARQLYSRAKRAWTLRMLGSIGIAAASPFVALWAEHAGEWLGAIAGGWIVISRFLARPYEHSVATRAADIQEGFDVKVLEVPWNPALGAPPPVQLVVSAARRHFKRNADKRRAALADWYADTGTVTPPHDALMCQRANLGWSGRLHAEWATLLIIALVVWAVVGIVVGIVEEFSLSRYLVALLLPSLPALVDAIDVSEEHRRHVRRRAAAERTAHAEWDAAMAGTKPLVLADVRLIQDSIWQLRREPIRVPNWYYELRKGAFETDMRTSASTLLSEATQSGHA